MSGFGLTDAILFGVTFALTTWGLFHIEYKMWENYCSGKRSWWNILYRK